MGLSSKAAQEAILALRVVDPACGTGVFLLAAAQRIARRLDALMRNPSDAESANRSTSLAEVISRCIYGVDIRNTAVQLC